ncbi:XIAP-associated factor 1-like protein [Tanacetum coccineum]
MNLLNFNKNTVRHRTEVNERLNKFSTELGAGSELGAVEAKLSASMAEMMMLSAIKLSNEQSSPKVGSSGDMAVNEGPKRSSLKFDDLGFPIPPFKEIPEGSNLRATGAIITGRIIECGSLRCHYLMERILMDGSTSKITVSFMGRMKRRLLERFQPLQEGTLYEQFLAITQEGSAREYISLFETLAGQLVGISEQVMEDHFTRVLAYIDLAAILPDHAHASPPPPILTKPLPLSGWPSLCQRSAMTMGRDVVSCSLCNETMEPEKLAVHRGEKCPQRMATCDYCEFPLPAVDLSVHQESCGNRTELCNLCNRYIRLREKVAHDVSCDGVADTIPAASRATREAERERAPRRRPPPRDFSTRRLLFTIAITGIAVLLGSFLFQSNSDQA